MTKHVKTLLLGVAAGIFVSTASAQINVVVDGSFENGTTNWVGHGGQTGDLTVDSSWIGKWHHFSDTFTNRMLLTDASASPFNITDQTDAGALFSRNDNLHSVVQIIDVSHLGDLTTMDWSLSVDFAELGTATDARIKFFGFDSFADVTADLVGAGVGVSGATLIDTSANLASSTKVGDFRTIIINQDTSDLQGVWDDYNYLVIELFGNVGTRNSDTELIAWDNVTMTIPEPSAYAILLGFGTLGFVLLRRRRQ